MSRGPEGDEADGSAVTRGRFAGRRKERGRSARADGATTTERRAGQRRHECTPACPDAAAAGEERTMSQRQGDAGRRKSEAEMV